jgi:hypothetical protein
MGIDFPVDYLVLLFAIASIVFGSVLLLQARKAGGSPQKKRSLKALVALGSLALIYSGWNIATGLRNLGYLDSVIGTMRELIGSEKRYAEAHPDVGYTCELSALSQDGLLTSPFENGVKNRYKFEITGCSDKDGKLPNTQFRLTARPLMRDWEAWCSDQSGVLWYEANGSVEKCLEKSTPW